MKMNRRDFLKWTGTAGLVVTGSSLWTPARSSATTHEGPYWLTINASGGWDPTLLCDPKGRISATQTDQVNNYYRDDIIPVGPFKVAPVDGHEVFLSGFAMICWSSTVDTQTTHETVIRYTWCGRGSRISSILRTCCRSLDPRLAFHFSQMVGTAKRRVAYLPPEFRTPMPSTSSRSRTVWTFRWMTLRTSPLH